MTIPDGYNIDFIDAIRYTIAMREFNENMRRKQTMIKKYKHKPTEIEAVQFNGDNLDEVIEFIGITGDYLIEKNNNHYTICQRGKENISLFVNCYVVKKDNKIDVQSNLLRDYEEIPQYTFRFFEPTIMDSNRGFGKIEITQPTGDKLTQIADHYGKEKQSQKTVEELAELIQAIVKYNADPCEETRLNFMETLAGVGISMGQLAYLYEFTPQELRDIEEFKIARTLQRIAEESHHVE